MSEVIALRLMVWALIWLGAALAGLWFATSGFWRAFWLMNGVWAFIDGVIAYAGLVGPSMADGTLRTVLFVNTGLDVVYVLVAVWLMRRRRPLLRGFGVAVLIQGTFLFFFDLLHALAIRVG